MTFPRAELFLKLKAGRISGRRTWRALHEGTTIKTTETNLPDRAGLGGDVTFDKDGREGTFLIPSLPFEAFTRSGHLGLWNIALLFIHVRIRVAYSPSPDNTEQFNRNPNIALFAIMSNFSVRDNFFHKSKKMKTRMALQGTDELLSIGDKSFIAKSTLRDPVTLEEYCHNLVKLLYVDTKQRKPIYLPEDFRKRHTSLVNRMQMKPARIKKRPKSAYYRKYIVQPSDCDPNNHSSSATYVRWCIDTATLASLGGFLEDFDKDVSRYLVKDVSVSYNGECRMGSTLTCYVWQEEPSILEFHIMEDERLKFHAFFRY